MQCFPTMEPIRVGYGLSHFFTHRISTGPHAPSISSPHTCSNSPYSKPNRLSHRVSHAFAYGILPTVVNENSQANEEADPHPHEEADPHALEEADPHTHEEADPHTHEEADPHAHAAR